MIEYPFKKNYLAMIENAAKGENWMFRNFYIIQDGVERDALENGGLSCAAFVSSILYLQNPLLDAIQTPHWISSTRATVASLQKDMLQNGWVEIKELRPGSVLIWEKREHDHAGFCVSQTEAVSNDSQGAGWPWRHDITYNGARKIEKILWHPALDND